MQNRIVVSATVKGERKEASLGLGIHLRPVHRCSPQNTYRIDWHPDSRPETHPGDFLSCTGCPAQHFDEALSAAISHAIEMDDLGGLGTYPQAAVLPWRFVQFYQAVLGARDRLIAERDRAQMGLYQ